MRFIKQIFLTQIVLLMLLRSGVALAQYSSSNYQVNELFFGVGGELTESSTSYQARAALGELGVGNSSSTNYQIYAGFNTTPDPYLAVNVTGGTFDLGLLSTTTVSAVTTTFTVLDYLSSGYIVEVVGTPPKNSSGGHALNNMATAGSSSPGTEQFGINLWNNNLTGPGAFGAQPQQVPDTTFGFGSVNSPYNVTNQFKYVEGDTVANSTKSSGITLYTLSMIANISKTTPGGNYGTSLFVVVVPTF